MNLVICKKDGTVFRVVKNAVRKGNRVEGDNGSWSGKPNLFDMVWTTQELTPVYGEDLFGLFRIIGYKETFSEINPETPPRGREQPGKIDREQRLHLLERLEDMADKSFADLESQIEQNVTTLSAAKSFMKQHAKVTLAIIKLLQNEMR